MAKREWVTHDFGWKVFSVFLAIVIWLTVHKVRDEPDFSSTTSDENIYNDLPVLTVSATADVHDALIVPAKVAVVIRGPSDLMTSLQSSQIHAFVNLSSIDAGHELKRHVDVATPPGMTVVSVDPADVTVSIPANKP